jgi:hypothetical protein
MSYPVPPSATGSTGAGDLILANDRRRYHGDDGLHRWVGLGVIANNLMNAATFSKARVVA